MTETANTEEEIRQSVQDALHAKPSIKSTDIAAISTRKDLVYDRFIRTDPVAADKIQTYLELWCIKLKVKDTQNPLMMELHQLAIQVVMREKMIDRIIEEDMITVNTITTGKNTATTTTHHVLYTPYNKMDQAIFRKMQDFGLIEKASGNKRKPSTLRDDLKRVAAKK